MRERPPLKLRRFAAAHNAVLFSLSLYMTVEVARQASAAKRQKRACKCPCREAVPEQPEPDPQAYRNFGWRSGLRLWCNQNEQGPFSDSGYKLARVLWVHYVSKARPALARGVLHPSA